MFLGKAVLASRQEAELREIKRPLAVLEKMIEERPDGRDFKSAIRRDGQSVKIIAEIKRGSPSMGIIKPDVLVSDQVKAYREGGASAVSVLTCAFKFKGSIEDLEAASRAVELPVLRKDFITTEYQVFEARAFGASAILLIAAALNRAEAARLMKCAAGLGMDVIFEVHNKKEVESAIEAGAEIVGINNRNLVTLSVDLKTTGRLMGLLPDGVIRVSESGISSRDDVLMLESLGVDALLIGGSLMGSKDPARALKGLAGTDTAGGGGDVD